MMDIFKPAAIAAVIAPLSAAPSFAQPLTWWDILSPDRVMQTITRYAVIMARTQVDLTFDDISTNLRGNRTTISNLRMWPVTPWRSGGICEVSVERITLNGQAFDNLDNVAIRLDAYETVVAPGCLPPELRAVLERFGLEELSLPSIGADLDYHIPSSRAQVSVLASVADVAEAMIAADFDYVSVRATGRRGDPVPIAALSGASVELHNLGGWEAVSQILPPAFTDETSAEAAAESVLRTAFTEMNRQSFDLPSEELSVLQLALISSMATAWGEFLQSPEQLVLEANIAPDRPVFLNFPTYENNPSWIVRDLNPVMRATASPVPGAVSRDAIDAALSGTWRDLPERERLSTGLALARGEGAPRNPALASEILAEFAEGGNVEAVAAIAEVLESVDPEAAYFWSILAGASGASGAASRLDRLEGGLAMPAILRLQAEAAERAAPDAELPTSIVGIRARARTHLTGIGANRNYRAAHTWASIGAALNDPASAALGDEIAKTLDAVQGADASDAVAALRQRSNSDALALWARLIPVLEAPQQATTRAVPTAPSETDAAPEVSDAELEACRQVLLDRLPGTFEAGGSCTANNAVLLRELAAVSRERDELRRLGMLPFDAEPPATAPQPEEPVAPVEALPEVVAPEAELAPDAPAARPAERAAMEAALSAENEMLREELAAREEEQLEDARRAAVLDQQVAALRSELATLQSLLDETASRDAADQVRIEELGAQLNAALARAAAEERRRTELAEAEARRLAEEAARTPSDAEVLDEVRATFLGDLREALSDHSGVAVADDRVVFSSGALFGPGSTALSAEGRAQITAVMERFSAAAGQIPPAVDWILRVDGHTDDVPISGGSFADNWELSQARALSVVRYLIDELGVPPRRLAAVGFGEFRPVNPESTAEARAQNRRIELLLTTR